MRILLSLVIITHAFIGFSQNMLWEKQYSFLQTNAAVESFDYYNGKYTLSLVGLTQTKNFGTLAVTNDLGDTLWTKTFIQYPYGGFRNPVKIIDGNIFYLPSYSVSPTVFDTTITVLLKVNFDGSYQKLEEYFIYGQNSFVARNILYENNKLYYVGLGNNSKIASLYGGGGKIALLKLDKNGKEIYQNFYPRADTVSVNTTPCSILRGHTGNLVIYADGNPPGKIHPYIVQLDAKYDTVKTKLLFPYKSLNYYYSQGGQMIYGTDGSYYICGAYKYQNADSVFASGRGKPFIAKLDTNFNVVWIKYSGGTYGFSSRIHELPSGDILFVSPEGRTKTFINIYKVGKDGTFIDSIQVSSNIGNKKIMDIRHMMYFEQDSSLVYAGVLDQYGYLAKISLKKLIVTGTQTEENKQLNLTLSPNPNTGLLQISCLQIGNLEIYDVQGLLVRKLKLDSPNQQINVQDLNSGTYLYRFSTESNVQYGKIIKQ